MTRTAPVRRTRNDRPRLGRLGLAVAGAAALLLTHALLVPPAARAADAPVPFTKADTDRVAKAFKAVRHGDPATALTLRAKLDDPLARRLVTWFLYLQGYPAGSFADITRFQRDHADWPVFYKFDQATERAITLRSDPAAVEAWFAQIPPRTFDGLRDAFAVLVRGGRIAAARDLVRRSWTEMLLTGTNRRSIYARFKATLRDQDQYDRVSDLLSRGKVRHARAAMTLAALDAPYRAAIAARLEMISKRTRRNVALVLKAIAKVPAALRQDADFRYALVRWNQRVGRDKEVARLLDAAPAHPSHPGRWWRVRQAAVRAAIGRHDYKLAYRLAAGHRQTGTDHESKAEFLAGFIALRLLGEPAKAVAHFKRGLGLVTSAWDVAQFAYWRGRAAEALGDVPTARAYYAEAARYGNTIYGQLATRRLGWAWLALITPKGTVPDASLRTDDLLRVAALLARIGEKPLAYQFAVRVMQRRAATAAQERYMVHWMADTFGDGGKRLKTIVRVTKYAHYRGFPLVFAGYPTIDLPADNVAEPALVYALIRQESEFYARAKSWVGARGLMQLMYFTARHEARDNKLRYSLHRLTADPAYNLRLGTAHLQRLLGMFDGAYPLVLAAYNAGAGRVQRWLARNGDPRTDPKRDWIDWIEMIPISETRLYVKRVLEAVPIYRLELGDSFDARELTEYWHAPKRDPKRDCALIAARRPSQRQPVRPQPPQVATTGDAGIAPAVVVPTLPTVLRGRRAKLAKRRRMNPSGIDLVQRRPRDNVPGTPDCTAAQHAD